MTFRLAWLAIFCSLCLLSCASKGYIEDNQQWPDFSQMKTVQMQLNEHAFIPQVLEFEAMKPYRLRITNQGMLKHNFAAERFFRSIYINRLTSKSNGEVYAPFFTTVAVEPGGSFDLWFVPVKTGNYDVICDVPEHKDKGMAGQLQIK